MPKAEQDLRNTERQSDDQSKVPDTSWRALARATYDQAVEIMENPPTLGTMRDLFDHRLGTYGQAYEVMNLGEAYAEIERLRQGLWDCAIASGMDHDGDLTPKHLASPDIVEVALREVRELRRDADEALGGGLA